MNTNAVVIANAGEAPQLMEKIQTMGVEYGAKILGALLVLIIGMWLAKMIKKGVVKLMEKRAVDPTLIAFCANLLHVVLKVFVIVAALEKIYPSDIVVYPRRQRIQFTRFQDLLIRFIKTAHLY